MAAAERVGTPQVSDEELIRRISDSGDHAAFEVLYARYFPRVFRFALSRLSNRADAEETTQEAFINVFSSIDSYRGDAPFAAWVLGVTRRTIASRFKRKRHATVPLDDGEEERIDPSHLCQHRGPTPLEAYEYRERIDHLQRTADRHLSEDQRALFQLHHLENRPIHEIARTLHRSEDSVKSNLYRARKLLLAR